MAGHPRGWNLCALVSIVRLNISRFRNPCQCEEFCNPCAGTRRIVGCKSSGFSRGSFRWTGNRSFWGLPLELTRLHIHSSPAKPHALAFQTQPLLDCRVPGEFDLAACTQYAL